VRFGFQEKASLEVGEVSSETEAPVLGERLMSSWSLLEFVLLASQPTTLKESRRGLLGKFQTMKDCKYSCGALPRRITKSTKSASPELIPISVLISATGRPPGTNPADKTFHCGSSIFEVT
jgi:hypothetical protein